MVDDLREIAKKVSRRRGWDFTRMRDDRDPVPWDYEEVARQYLTPTARVLDIGTGGGERFLRLAEHYGSGLGTDVDPQMIAVAEENTSPALRGKVSWAVMPAAALTVADASFDVVLNRHAPVVVSEIARALRPGGYFVTQQVGRHNMQNVFEAFGWASSGSWWDAQQADLGEPWHPARASSAFEAAGCEIVALGEYDVGYYVQDVASLIFWFQSVPLPEPFDIDRHEELIRSFANRNQTPRGIVSNEQRNLLIVRKP